MSPHQLDRERRTAPQIFDHLYERIVSLDIVPNSVLVRTDLQEQFGVSQTPVRDALMRLEHIGLVHIFPQHATRVARIDLRAAREAHFLRLSVELEAMSLTVLRRSADDLQEMYQLIERQQQAVDLAELNLFSQFDRQFHACFYRIAGVTKLQDMIQSRSVHIDRLRKLHLPLAGKPAQVIRDHLRIVDAVAERDAERARTELRRHLSGTLAMVDEIRQKYPEYIVD